MSWEPVIITPTTFICGLDLGQANDYSALIVAERITGPDGLTSYDVRSIERLPLQAPYPVQVRHTFDVIRNLAAIGSTPKLHLVVDYTGCGRPVAGLLTDAGFDELGCSLAFVTITGGDAVTKGAHNEYRVPKRDLVSAVLVLLQSKRLRFAADDPLSKTLRTELTGFRAKISLSGHDSYGAGEDWRSAPHDDLVLATAMAVWYGETAMIGGWDHELHAGLSAWLQTTGV